MTSAGRRRRPVPDPIPSRRRHERPPSRPVARAGRFSCQVRPRALRSRLRLAPLDDALAHSFGPRPLDRAACAFASAPGTSTPSACAPSRSPASSTSSAPDVLCLQEIKCREGEFPAEAFVDMGLPHLKIAGQKGWHGVAIASRLPIEDAPPLDVCRERPRPLRRGHGRGRRDPQLLHPGRRRHRPTARPNPKFDHKLDFYEQLTAEMARARPEGPAGRRRRPQRGARASTTSGTTSTCRRSSATRRSRSRPWRALKASLRLHRPGARGRSPSRRSCSPGGATAPPTSASPTAACASTTCWVTPGLTRRRVPPGRAGRAGPRRRARMGAAQRPRAGQRGPGALAPDRRRTCDRAAVASRPIRASS